MPKSCANAVKEWLAGNEQHGMGMDNRGCGAGVYVAVRLAVCEGFLNDGGGISNTKRACVVFPAKARVVSVAKEGIEWQLDHKDSQLTAS